MKTILNRLFEYKTLSKSESKDILKNITMAKYNTSQIASFLSVFMMRSITVEELAGFKEAMLELCIPLDLSEYDPIDLCGTGGDDKNTFNISTTASFIVAGSGIKVAKHGNYGVSSFCGSSNVLEHFGYQFTDDKDTLKRNIEEAGICYLHAPLFHPAMKNVAPVRKELGVKTFFNMLGPMVNPAFVKKQVVGVFSLELVRLYAYLFQQTDMNYIVYHSIDGYDEISLTGPFKMVSNSKEQILQPEDINMERIDPIEISGGESISDSAKIIMDILNGVGTKAQNQVVLASAGLAIHCAKPEFALNDAVAMARESLDSKRALKSFKNMMG